jgi:molecular chaperone GrpE
MNMKHKKSTEEEKGKHVEAGSTDDVAEKQPESAESSKIEVEEPAEEDPNKKILELNDKLLRLYSEFDNYRKRTIKENSEIRKTASEDLIKDLLPVLDDFERAIKSFETTDQVEALKEGINIIFSKFRNILSMRGLQEIVSVGAPFDTDQQEAIAHIPAPSEELKSKVVDEIQKGYKLNEKVIRFAKVVVGS